MQGRFFVFSPRMKKIEMDDLARQCTRIGIGLRISQCRSQDRYPNVRGAFTVETRPYHGDESRCRLGRTNPYLFLGGKGLGIQQGTSV